MAKETIQGKDIKKTIICNLKLVSYDSAFTVLIVRSIKIERRLIAKKCRKPECNALKVKRNPVGKLNLEESSAIMSWLSLK